MPDLYIETTAGALTSAMRTATSVMERRNTLPIIGAVLISDKSITATDLESEVTAVFAHTRCLGTAVIEAWPLTRLLRELPREMPVSLRAGSSGAELAYENGLCELHVYPPEDFPRTRFDTQCPQHLHEIGDLHTAIERALGFAGTNEMRPYLCGTHFRTEDDGRVRVVATNGHQAIRIHTDIFADLDQGVTIPTKPARLMALAPLLNLEIFGETGIAAFSAGLKIRSRLIGAKYPDYQRVFPSRDVPPKATIVFDRSAFAGVLRRLGAIAGRRAAFDMAIADGTAVIGTDAHLHQDQRARETMPVHQLSGEQVRFGFNGDYMRGILGAFRDTSSVRAEFQDASSPARIVSVDDPETAEVVLMPIRGGLGSFLLDALPPQTPKPEAA